MQNSILSLITSSTINIIMLLVLLFLISKNTIMPVRTTKAYITAIIFTVIVIVAELSTSMLDLLGPAFRIPNIIANIVGFSLSTCIPFLLVRVFTEKLDRKCKYLLMLIAFNFLLLISSPWTGWIFYVSVDNQYTRGPLFGVYIITYLYGLVVLMVSNHQQSLKYQDTERSFLLILYGIFFIGTTIQVLFPFIHSSWHCISLVLVMYYLFQRELQFKYDIVTEVLNRQAFEKKLQAISATDHSGIILFDLDGFKIINDTYGHAKGDYYLKAAASIIKNCSKEIGQCYRIGGDEFCVLAKNTSEAAIRKCINLMLQSFKKAREADTIMPLISYGYSIYNNSEHGDILSSFQDADKKMYTCKKSRQLDSLYKR
ncbi:GGDEF domain-containing protein [Anaerocolumna chitinilytica]|uniref:GGDEF domain-containing protein n=1 Tax=Anaerocolumna chitinilytica TaxID=1727145 RepID=UPI001A9ABAC9|nr:GGDEF domain-containing protein [Anaerocolumna chitinilytica]